MNQTPLEDLQKEFNELINDINHKILRASQRLVSEIMDVHYSVEECNIVNSKIIALQGIKNLIYQGG